LREQEIVNEPDKNDTMSRTILHIPHSSAIIPFYDGYSLSKKRLAEEINLLTDWYTDELFDVSHTKIVVPFSRIFCDVERFSDDSQEVMANYGMGMCYTHFDNGELIRDVTPELRSGIKTRFYDQHHKLLENQCSKALKDNKKVLLVDCHSFPDKPLKRDLIQDVPRPDFCIGSDGFHTPRELVDASLGFLYKKGYEALENNPYSGTIIPMKYYQKNMRVMGIMIEVSRKLYMSEENGEIKKTSNFNAIRELIAEWVSHLSSIEI